jgi:hypothetical protein
LSTATSRAYAEHVGEQTFGQAMTPQDADCDLESGAGQLGLAACAVVDVAVAGELLEHARDRGGRDAEFGCEAGRRDAGPLTLETIDRLEILLGGLVEVRMTRHNEGLVRYDARHVRAITI